MDLVERDLEEPELCDRLYPLWFEETRSRERKGSNQHDVKSNGTRLARRKALCQHLTKQVMSLSSFSSIGSLVLHPYYGTIVVLQAKCHR